MEFDNLVYNLKSYFALEDKARQKETRLLKQKICLLSAELYTQSIEINKTISKEVDYINRISVLERYIKAVCSILLASLIANILLLASLLTSN